jgi:hypothetical protein
MLVGGLATPIAGNGPHIIPNAQQRRASLPSYAVAMAVEGTMPSCLQDVAAYQQQYPITQQLHANILLLYARKDSAACPQSCSSPEHQVWTNALQDLEQLVAALQAATAAAGNCGSIAKGQQGAEASTAAAGPAQQFLQKVGSTRNGLTSLKQVRGV